MRRATLACVLLLFAGCICMPPGFSYRGPLDPLTSAQQERAATLRADVAVLAERIGPRCLEKSDDKLTAAAEWIGEELSKAGYAVDRQTYAIRGRSCVNLAVERRGATRPDEIVVLGAHYDSVCWSPGANDNGSGVAAVLALARLFRDRPVDRTLRFVFFTNEEYPYCSSERMGSYQYARRCREHGEMIIAMISLDEIGCFSDRPGSQKAVFPMNLLYPSRGDYICVVANADNHRLMSRVTTAMRRHVKFPAEGLAVNASDVERSDHWAFVRFGYPAVLITDTAPFRYPHYHRPTDTPDKLDYDRMARLVDGLVGAVGELCAAAR